MYTNKNCEARQCQEQLLESSGKLYDGMVNAVATWPEEMKAASPGACHVLVCRSPEGCGT